MPLRDIIRIDEDKCDGCAECVTACAEGALEIVNGKAKLVGEIYCDGFGVCVGNCPQGAIIIEKREAEAYDEQKTMQRLAKKRTEEVEPLPQPIAAPTVSACPGSRMRTMQPVTASFASVQPEGRPSTLRNWPIQLHLIPPHAPFLSNADLLLTADCVPYAHNGFHEEFLAGKVLAIACPKLDNVSPYVEKLAQIFATQRLKSLSILKMEVPCCNGIVQIAMAALQASGVQLPVREITFGVQGGVLLERELIR